ncbi:MAG: acylphosphatase [Candidatus Thermoplasmatota archaeon]|nr:acylphosphatase [Candidatus Thermoplasmatota archaeon]MBU1941625.1 acylphosphatase [Candidatus Thermoplasmatota archaeon]
MKKQAHVVISGRVQGVWYRASTKNQAQMLGLKGWVRNLKNGNVEAVFEGDEEIIDKMISWCHQGPPHASVKKVLVAFSAFTGEFCEFSIMN